MKVLNREQPLLNLDESPILKRFLTNLLILGCLLGSLSSAFVLLSDNTPEVVLSPAAKDFGEVRQNKTLDAAFVLTNRSRRVFRLQSVQKSYDCTDVRYTETLLRPYQTLNLDLKWQTGVKRGSSRTAFVVALAEEKGGIIELKGEIGGYVHPNYQVSATELIFRDGPQSSDHQPFC